MKPEITITPSKPALLKSLNEKEPSQDFDWLGLMAGITHLHVAGHDVIGIVDSALKGAEGVGGCTEGRADEHKSDGQGEDKGRPNRANDSEVTVRQTGRDCDCAKDLQLPNPKHYQLQVPTSGYQGPSTDSQTLPGPSVESGELEAAVNIPAVASQDLEEK